MTIEDKEMNILVLVGKTVRSTDKVREKLDSTKYPEDRLVLLQEHRALLRDRLEELNNMDSDESRVTSMIEQVSERLNYAILKIDAAVDQLVNLTADNLDADLGIMNYRKLGGRYNDEHRRG